VIVAPPESIGAFQVTFTPPFNGVNLTPTTAPGADLGVVEIAFDEAEVPPSFTATTVTDCNDPLVRPEIVQVVLATVEPPLLEDPSTSHIFPEGIALAMYLVIGEPLKSAFVEIALHLTTKLWFCGSNETKVGAIDTPRGVVVPATEADGPSPAPLTAETLIEYLEPLDRPRTKQLVAVDGALQLNTFAPKVAVAT
jgi:hypothetical protein